jgi:tRNA(Ile)-lysidine synthase
MLLALDAVRQPFSLSCLHVEHGLRGEESRADAEAVRALCGRLNVPCRIVSVKPGKIAAAAREKGSGIEAAARNIRHAAFRAEAAHTGARAILVAHTEDDLLETTLMRILRGSGPAGLAAMPPQNGLILRPLLRLRRADVVSYLAMRGVAPRIDSTNSDERYLRNRVRGRLIPALDASFPGWRQGIRSLAGTQRLVADFIAEETKPLVKPAAETKPLARRQGAARISPSALRIPNFFALPRILREEAVFDAIGRLKREQKKTFSPDLPPRRERPPRRSVVRRFASGEVSSASLGAYRLTADAEGGALVQALSPVSSEGFFIAATPAIRNSNNTNVPFILFEL